MFAAFAAARMILRNGGARAGHKRESNQQTAKITHCRFPAIVAFRPVSLPGTGNARGVLFELNAALDLNCKSGAFDRQRHFGRQCFVSFQPAAGDRFSYRLLDLALRGNADLFEKFAHTDVEYIFVHDRLAKVPERWLSAMHSIGLRGWQTCRQRRGEARPSRWTTPIRSGKFGSFRP